MRIEEPDGVLVEFQDLVQKSISASQEEKIEKMTITRDQLYDAAFKYKKTGIWKKLWDNEIFAVKLNNGETGYICTMGKDSGLNAVNVFIGEEGFNSYRMIEELKASTTVPPLKGLEILTMQSCLQVEFVEESVLHRRKGRMFGHLPERMAFVWQARTHSHA